MHLAQDNDVVHTLTPDRSDQPLGKTILPGRTDGRRSAMISDRIRPHHLERKAILYVRQSSAHQVLQ